MFQIKRYISSAGGAAESVLLADKGCSQEKKVKGGTQQISEKLLERIMSHSNEDKFLLNTELVKIDQSNTDFVRVITRSTLSNETSEFKARKVISAIPLNQYVNIEFEPELPSKRRNFFKFSQMGSLVKFLVTYKKAFWKEKGFSGEFISDGSIVSPVNWKDKKMPSLGPITCLYDATTHENQPALVGFRAARASIEWQGIILLD